MAVGAEGIIESSGLPPPRNLRRMAEAVRNIRLLRMACSAESVIIAAAYSTGTWRRRLLVIREVGKRKDKAAGIVTWATRAMVEGRWVPTTAMTMVECAIAVYPETKGDVRLAEWRRGLGALYGRTAWYVRGPIMTALDFLRVMQLGKTWFKVRIDVMFHAFGRDADLTGVLVADIVWQTEDEVEVYFPFLKNDQESTEGTRKRVRLADPGGLRRWLQGRSDDEMAFPQRYDEVLEEIKRVLGEEYGTRAVRRGAADMAEQQGVGREAMKLLLAHKTVVQQRTYVGRLNHEEVEMQREVQELMRRGIDESLTSSTTVMNANTATTSHRGRGRGVVAEKSMRVTKKVMPVAQSCGPGGAVAAFLAAQPVDVMDDDE